MGITTLEKALWVAGFLGHFALLSVLLIRSRWRTFPVFTSLITYQVVVTAVLFLFFHFGTSHAYFLGYWTLAGGDYLLQVALIFEIARNVFHPAGTWIRTARKRFVLWSAVGVSIAAGLCITISPPATEGLDLWEMRATLFTSLMICALFLSISSVANRFGVPWRSHVMALGQGLVAWATLAVLGDVVHIATGWRGEFILFDRLRMYTYLGALVFWTVAFWQPETVRPPLSPEMLEVVHALHKRVRHDLGTIRN